MQKAVVFGGSGFLGSHVADNLSKAGYQVVIYDMHPSPFLGPSQKMVLGNLSDLELITDTVESASVVFNFAALSDLNEALRQPVSSVTVNILGNCHILESCRVCNVERFVYASSVYVNSREGGFYGCSKSS